MRKTVTVVFCDLVGSTELGERLDPEALRGVLDRYFDAIRSEVSRHGGIVEKFIGDAVMAVFGIPVLHEDDALRAVRAAAAIPLAVRRIDPELRRRWDVELHVRIGVSTGEVVAAPAAGEGGQRLATGDAVNLAARLQALAGTDEVVLADATERLVRAAVRIRELGAVAVKGKAEPVRAWRLAGLRPEAPSSDLVTASPLQGRREELDTVDSTWADVLTAARPRRLLVLGPAGVGKSRLLREFLARSGGGATVLRGRCLSYGEGITFWPLREMLAAAARWGQDDTAEQALSKLADLMPGRPDAESVAERIGQLLGLVESTAGLPESFWAVAQLLGETARWTPVILVVDDLHWAERPLLDLLDHLAGAVAGPVLLLGGARPEVDDAHPDWAGPAWARLSLDPLAAGDAAGLVDQLLSPGTPPTAVREHVLAVAEGNPLFVEQLVGMLQESGTLRREDGAWVLGRELVPGELPGTISSLLAARLDRLPPAARREIEAGAVVGRVFWRAAVAELARDAVGPEAGRHLVDLVRRQLILPEPSGSIGDEAYKFHHVLVRDAAYAAMSKTDRATAHRRFADWLETVAGERVAEYDEILGYHREQAVRLQEEVGLLDDTDGDLALRAGRHLAAAGWRAQARGDVSTTVNLLSRAERLLVEDPPRRAHALLELGRALQYAGDLGPARDRILAAMDEAVAVGDRRGVVRARVLLEENASFLDPAWQISRAQQVLQEAVSALTELEDDVGLAETWFLIGRESFDTGHAADAEGALARARFHGRRSERPETASQPTSWLLIALLIGPTPVDVVAARLEAIAEETGGDLVVKAELLSMSGLLAAMRRQFHRAWTLLKDGDRLFTDLGMVTAVAAGGAQVAFEIARRQGDIAAAEPALVAGDRLLDRIGDHRIRSTLLAMLGHVHGARGRWDEARRCAEQARDTTQPNDLFSEVLWRTALGRARAAEGNLEAADALVVEAVTLAEASDWLCLHGDALLDLAEVRWAAGRLDVAATAARTALGLYTRKGDLALGDRARTLLRALHAERSD
ncbi:ATP-binding protein [Geodermatophilus amargosae]|uniref:ATP-binding protein n=1 Tax=Geodermatophilus amargosae TaxID=1296565 RepID=UPI0034DF25F1